MERKGARSIKEIPSNILEALNRGEIQTVNLMEWLAIDQLQLIKRVLVNLNMVDYFEIFQSEASKIQNPTAIKVSTTIGKAIHQITKEEDRERLLMSIQNHTSDTVRSWLAFYIANDTTISRLEKFKRVKLLAADSHFGVREQAWMAMRNELELGLIESIEILSEWVNSIDENIRRFASEISRPRGVWCKHINLLKENPHLAISIIEPLMRDESKYVKDSVGNWLNDASKTAPKFVKEFCNKWKDKEENSNTSYILKKGMRNLIKEEK